MIRVKICGLSRPEDIDAVNHALPDYIGFVFAPSRRRVDEKTAARLKERLDARIRAVGVFVNQDMQTVAALYRNGVIGLVQLHGDEDEGYARRLRDSCGCGIIRSVAVGAGLPPVPEGYDYLLFDTATAQRGGTGKTFDWNLLKGYSGPPYFLSGGLAAENLPRAIEALSPFCLDVSSGVETGGVKDAEKIDQFIRIAKGLA